LSLRASFAADLRARGDFGTALELDKESRELFDARYGKRDSRSLRLLSSLALDYGLNSNYRVARDLYDEAFRGMSRPTSDASATDLLGAYIGISWTLRLMGRYKQAFDVSQDAWDYGQKPEGLGPEHLSTLRSVNGYTIVSRRIPERRLEALDLGKKTLELSTRLFGEDHPDTLAIAVSVSNLQRTISDRLHGEALELAAKTVERYPDVYGDDHPYNFGCLSNLALLRRVTGDPARAREDDQRALDGLTDRLGPEHHFTLAVAINLASDYALLGKLEEARRVGEETLPRLTRLLGADHPHTLGCASNLALDLIAAGDEDAGESLREKTLLLYEKAQGPLFPDTVVALAGNRLDPDFDPPPI